MQVDGKQARTRIAQRNDLPGYLIKHERPFSVNFGRRGPMAEDIGIFVKKNREKDQNIETSMKTRASSLPNL